MVESKSQRGGLIQLISLCFPVFVTVVGTSIFEPGDNPNYWCFFWTIGFFILPEILFIAYTFNIGIIVIGIFITVLHLIFSIIILKSESENVHFALGILSIVSIVNYFIVANLTFYYSFRLGFALYRLSPKLTPSFGFFGIVIGSIYTIYNTKKNYKIIAIIIGLLIGFVIGIVYLFLFSYNYRYMIPLIIGIIVAAIVSVILGYWGMKKEK